MTDHFTDTISAFVDGEPVDPDRLAAALDDREARAALVDFVRLRAVVRAGDPPLPASLDHLRTPTVAAGWAFRWPAVAALLLLVFLAGLAAPRPWNGEEVAAADAPPPPTRVEKFTPGVDWHPTN